MPSLLSGTFKAISTRAVVTEQQSDYNDTTEHRLLIGLLVRY